MKRTKKARSTPKLHREKMPPDLYGADIVFLYGTVDQIEHALTDALPSEPAKLSRAIAGHFSVLVHNNVETQFICVVRRGTMNSRRAALAHEVLHCVGYTLTRAGIKYVDNVTDEAWTYYLQYLFAICQHAIDDAA